MESDTHTSEPDVGLTLGQRLRRRPNVNPTLFQRLVGAQTGSVYSSVRVIIFHSISILGHKNLGWIYFDK